MNNEAKDIAKNMLSIIAAGKDYSQVKDFNQIFGDAENIISAMAYLIGPLLNAEQEYRKLKLSFIEQGDTSAKAETKAKASDEYVNYRKLQYAYDLGKEQVMLLKKWKDSLELEYARTKN